MARMNVNPTRMELKRLKARLKTAERGHKLLKDKSDEMVRRFSVLIRENKRLRDETDADTAAVLQEFSKARSLISVEEIETAFSLPTKTVTVKTGIKNVMSVEVPEMEVGVETSGGGYPYAFSTVTSEMDYTTKMAADLTLKLLKLAEVEKAAEMLAIEIERNKRRVNALEYVMIPELNETIKYIRQKLDENERSATTRLMKVKTFINSD